MGIDSAERTEQEIFDELAALCTSPGYAHAIAYFCYRDNFVRYVDEISAEDVKHLFSETRLIKTEISLLIGLMIKQEINYVRPSGEILQQYLDRTEALLEEMHRAMGRPIFAALDSARDGENPIDPFSLGEALREPIFYSGDAAYGFQYRDFVSRKYAPDNEWLKLNKGFSIQSARDVVHALERLHTNRLSGTVHALMTLPLDEWTLLPGFEFTVDELSEASDIDKDVIKEVLAAFTLSEGERNRSFCKLHDFNAAEATPLLRGQDGGLILFAGYALAEALYESPFYWMIADARYIDTAMRHRGQFTEEFSKERLGLVFGTDNVYSNVNICESKGKICGEIDVLVLFGNRAIILQAKSKRLTIESRRGNDRQIKSDFHQSVQASYDQAYECAKLLGNPRYTFIDANSREIAVPVAPKEIYILCVVCDSYPALNFQARQLLRYEKTETVQAPLITDIFNLDVMTEMLESPLHFLSYINRRTTYDERLMARDEMTILACHLKRNLWIEDSYDLVMLADSISADLDIAMSVRRDNVSGKKTPEGILTRFAGTAVDRILKQIETTPNSGMIDLGFVLLRLSEDAILRLSSAIDATLSKARQDGTSHDVSIGLRDAGTGLTIHCNDDAAPLAAHKLRRHCRLRKYAQKASNWFGICLSPRDIAVRFGLSLSFEWESNPNMDAAIRTLPAASRNFDNVRGGKGSKSKVGRNDLCPCGSGLKYKKCCSK